MAVYPRTYREFAEEIASQYSTEIAHRVAISCGYYCAFLYTKDHLMRNGKSFQQNGNDHGLSEDYLREQGEHDLADRLAYLREKRKKADYQPGRTLDEDELTNFLAELSDFMTGAQTAF